MIEALTLTLTVIGIGVAGGVGAAVRHLVDRAVSARFRARFPIGIMLINVSGSFALGILVGSAIDNPWVPIAATGFLGGFTTFSTASLDTLRLVRRRRYLAAAVNGPGMLVLGVGFAILGMLLGMLLGMPLTRG